MPELQELTLSKCRDFSEQDLMDGLLHGKLVIRHLLLIVFYLVWESLKLCQVIIGKTKMTSVVFLSWCIRNYSHTCITVCFSMAPHWSPTFLLFICPFVHLLFHLSKSKILFRLVSTGMYYSESYLLMPWKFFVVTVISLTFNLSLIF